MQDTRFGFVAVIGAPNAGKSTLVNALVGAKVSIVTPRQQTTRNRILGIFIEGQSQIALMDTPGIFLPKRRLDRAMVSAAWGGVKEADLILLMIDARKGIYPEVQAILERLQGQKGKEICLVLNKIDLVPRPELLAMVKLLNEEVAFSDSYLISALNGDGLLDLKAKLALKVPAGPWMFEEDQLSDLPERLLAAEITRERLFLRLRDELPYAMTVETESWEAKADGSVLLSQIIYVTKDTHRAIVLGRGGQQIKEIGQSARHEIGKMLDCEVHLKLFVKHREKWQEDPERYQIWNLDFNPSDD